jgi:hypothetical protein
MVIVLTKNESVVVGAVITTMLPSASGSGTDECFYRKSKKTFVSQSDFALVYFKIST